MQINTSQQNNIDLAIHIGYEEFLKMGLPVYNSVV